MIPLKIRSSSLCSWRKKGRKEKRKEGEERNKERGKNRKYIGKDKRQ